MKYIVFGKLFPVIFPSTINHSDMAEFVKRQAPAWEPTSAGFVKFDIDGNLHTGGSSLTLNIKAVPEDTALIKRYLEQDMG